MLVAFILGSIAVRNTWSGQVPSPRQGEFLEGVACPWGKNGGEYRYYTGGPADRRIPSRRVYDAFGPSRNENRRETATKTGNRARPFTTTTAIGRVNGGWSPGPGSCRLCAGDRTRNATGRFVEPLSIVCIYLSVRRASKNRTNVWFRKIRRRFSRKYFGRFERFESGICPERVINVRRRRNIR